MGWGWNFPLLLLFSAILNDPWENILLDRVGMGSFLVDKVLYFSGFHGCFAEMKALLEVF